MTDLAARALRRSEGSCSATAVAHELLAAVACVACLAVAELAWLAERGRGTFASFGDALLWATTVVVGTQGDPVPESALGRLVMLGGFGVLLVLVATLAGTVGAYLLEERRERAAREEPAG